ncbi:MAG: glycosyltransferase [Methanoregula sp.]|nr:glycosyltransferase [Methanoregula sp.]
MTTYNREKYLPKAIDSILAQSFSDWELIIVDDGSIDNTEQVVREYTAKYSTIKFFKNENNLGIVKSRNLALNMCAGEYVAVLDSDDEWADKNKLQKQINFFGQNPDYVLCGTMAKIINENNEEGGNVIHKISDTEIRKRILFGNQFVHSSVMYRRAAALAAGGYGEFGVGEDYDLFLRLGLKGKVGNLPDIMVNYRRHPDGATWKNRLFSAREHLRIIQIYRAAYPNFFSALVKAYLRIFLARLK